MIQNFAKHIGFEESFEQKLTDRKKGNVGSITAQSSEKNWRHNGVDSRLVCME